MDRIDGNRMKRNPGEWLRGQLFKRAFDAFGILAFGIGWILASVLMATNNSPLWLAISAGVGICLLGLWILLKGKGKDTESWRLQDMRKGTRSEERIGANIEYALTRPYCAVAHGVTEIAKVGDIDHLIATPQRLWVVESKYGRLPKNRFPETLDRIAANVDAVSNWAPGTEVIGCLVFGGTENVSAKSSYTAKNKRILCFGNPESLVRKLRAGSGAERTISEEVVQRVWRLSGVMGAE